MKKLILITLIAMNMIGCDEKLLEAIEKDSQTQSCELIQSTVDKLFDDLPIYKVEIDLDENLFYLFFTETSSIESEIDDSELPDISHCPLEYFRESLDSEEQ